jgi:hypothetical protein
MHGAISLSAECFYAFACKSSCYMGDYVHASHQDSSSSPASAYQCEDFKL